MNRVAVAAPVSSGPQRAGWALAILVALCAKEGNGRPGEQGDLTLFEPHTFFTVTLAEGGDSGARAGKEKKTK